MNGLYKKDRLLVEVSKLDSDKLYTVKVEVYDEKRTKTMNSYYWVLVTKLANALRTNKDELHEELIRRYSQRDWVSLLSSVNVRGYFKYFDKQGTYKQSGNTFNSYLVYKRSSDMSKQEFSILLDGLISECKECDIETMTPDQLAQLKFIENVSNRN